MKHSLFVVLCVVLCVVTLVSCAPVQQAEGTAKTNYDGSVQATLVGTTPYVRIYKFQDGMRSCYVTESTVSGGQMMSSGAAIWCTP